MGSKKALREKRAVAQRRGVGCLFWICLAAVLVAVAFAARAPIQDGLGRLFGGKARGASVLPRVTVKPLQEAGKDRDGPQSRAGKENSKSEARPGAATAAPQAAQREEKPPVRKARLFFVTVDAGGTILMKGVIRPIPAGDSPLRDVLDTLLKGPTAQEMNIGLLTMIPTDAKLRGVTVHGDTAYLDFSESFRFNSMGIEGLTAQLRQIVYAATEFPTVKKVQVLIEGKKVGYLGTEGVRIDEPLTRSSFQE